MQDVGSPTREQLLLLHQFLAGLPPTARGHLWAVGEMRELEKTEKWARMLMVLDDQEQTAVVPMDNS